MKRLLSIALCILLLLTATACGGGSVEENVDLSGTDGYVEGAVQGGDYSADVIEKDPEKNPEIKNNPTVMGVFYRNPVGAPMASEDATVKEVDAKADAMLKKIEDYPDTLKPKDGGKAYYISNDGDDTNDGLTPETAMKTFLAVKGKVKSGDIILFRRGDIFRGQMSMIEGVSFGAYGSGIKPRIYGSVDGTEGEWVETSTKGVYTYSKGATYANIVFNNGEKVSRPVHSMAELTKAPLNVFYNGRINIYCPDGNPKDVFDSIEIVSDYTLFRAVEGYTRDVTLQNLCLMYAGTHCVATGDAENVTIEGCIMGYCGGRDLFMSSTTISLGNCVEIWARGVNVNIHDNYFFQAYDTGITHQGPTNADNFEGADYTNIHYENNLIEYCTYGIEAFSLRKRDEQAKKPNANWNYNDVYIKENIIRYSGWGWGSLDRPDKNVYADIVYDALGENGSVIHQKPLIIENNIFDRSRKRTINIASPENNKANMVLKNNQFILAKNGVPYMNGGVSYGVNKDYESAFKKYFSEYSGNTFKVIG